MMSIQKIWLGSFVVERITFGNYVEVFTSIPAAINGIKNSAILALSGATMGMVLSLLIVQGLIRTKLRGHRVVDLITSLPVGIPGIVLAMGVLLIAIRTPLYGSLTILLFAYLLHFLPLGVRSVSGVMIAVSAELEEASRACGAGYFKTLLRVAVPLVKPGLEAGWILLFVLFLRELPMSVLLYQSGSEVMSVALWQLMEHSTPGNTAAYAMIQSAMILFLVLIFQVIIRERKST